MPPDHEQPSFFEKDRTETPRAKRTVRRAKAGSDLRKFRGLLIAAAGGIVSRGGGVFNVPSQSAAGANYSTEFHENADVSFGCKDWKKRRRKRACKHGFAVTYALAHIGKAWREVPADTELPAVPLTTESQAEAEDLRLFQDVRRNIIMDPVFPFGTATFRTRKKKAARIMRDRLPRMLHQLLEEVAQERPVHAGRPGLLLHQRAFCVLFRVFENRPLADVCMMLGYWQGQGLLPTSPGVNMLCNYMHDSRLPELFELLTDKIAKTVRKLESAVVMDSSSFSTFWSANYLDTDRGKRVYRARNRWIKPHVAAGPVTSVVSAIHLTWNKKGDPLDKLNPTADVNFFLPLIRKTYERSWPLALAAADKGYVDDDHFKIPMQEMGIRIFIPFKKNAVYNGHSQEWQDMLTMFDDYPEEFDRQYNRIRPKIDGVFSACKRTTGDWVWSRGVLIPSEASDEQLVQIDISRRNEVLAKFIIHSLRKLVLLECMHDDIADFTGVRAFQPLPREDVLLEEARGEMLGTEGRMGVAPAEEDEEAG
jgi:hypothetical protein